MAMRNDLSSSWTRTSPPARALASSLSTRASLSIPPASEGYEPIVKRVLRYRLVNYIVPYSLLLSWLLLSSERIWNEAGSFQDALLIPLSPLTFLWSISHWIIGALPIIIMRKIYLTGGHPLGLFYSLCYATMFLRAIARQFAVICLPASTRY
jgi:nucleoporin NDC1